jgi:predicted Zn-dependent protease
MSNRHNRFLYSKCGFLIFALSVALLYAVAADAVPFVSKQTELEIGRGADQDVSVHYGIYQDKAVQLYVNQVGQKLVSHLSDKEFENYYFKVVDSSEINAFALPGGYIYVTRGILAMINNESELAGVMGHEIGHVIFHHGAQSMVRSIGAAILSVAGAVAARQNAGQWLMVSQAMFGQINLGYGRDAELESDAQGIMNSTETGYHPDGMVNFLKTLRRQELFSGQAYHAFAASHPETKERIIKTEAFSTSLIKREGTMVVGRDEYLNQIRGMPFGGKRDTKDRRVYKDQFVDLYQVKPGDTFTAIAKKELGDEKKDMEVAVLNGRKTEDHLTPGEWMKIIRDGKAPRDKELVVLPDPAMRPMPKPQPQPGYEQR